MSGFQIQYEALLHFFPWKAYVTMYFCTVLTAGAKDSVTMSYLVKWLVFRATF